jgi:hypothetical protein
MRRRLAAAAVGMAAGLASAASAAPVESRYSKTSGAGCRTVEQDVEASVEMCRGPGGVPVLISTGDARTTVSYGPRAATELAAREAFARLNSVGETIEWRGERDARGFTPFATILRWRIMDPDTPRAVLVVTRLKPGATCHVAYIDAAANTEPNALARRAADERARSFRCGREAPTVLGNPGPASKLAVESRNVRR